jgi:Universal stress protein family
MPAPEHGREPRIVAGVDGSASSLSALRWAIRQAGLTGASVDAVTAWHLPGRYRRLRVGPGGMVQDYDFKEIARRPSPARSATPLIRAAASVFVPA